MTSLIVAHEELDACFECGILQADHVSKIKSIRLKVLNHLKQCWRIDDQTIEKMSESESFVKAYERLRKDSPNIANTSRLVDKFPDYARRLDEIAECYDIPIIFIDRDPRAIFWSREKARLTTEEIAKSLDKKICFSDLKISVNNFIKEYISIRDRVLEADARFPGRISFFSLESVVENIEYERNRLFKAIGLTVPDSLFGDVHAIKGKLRDGVDRRVLTEYKDHLSTEVEEYFLETVGRLSVLQRD